MSKKLNVVGSHVTPDDVKKYIGIFLPIITSLSVWLPDNVKKFVTLGTGLLSQPWAVELLVFLLNTFEDKQLSEKQVAQALDHFADKLDKGETPPVKFDLE